MLLARMMLFYVGWAYLSANRAVIWTFLRLRVVVVDLQITCDHLLAVNFYSIKRHRFGAELSSERLYLLGKDGLFHNIFNIFKARFPSWFYLK